MWSDGEFLVESGGEFLVWSDGEFLVESGGVSGGEW